MNPLLLSIGSSFTQREIVAPLGLWERGAGVSGYVPTSARLFPKISILSDQHRSADPALNANRVSCRSTASIPRLEPLTNSKNHRALKAFATSPTGETPRFSFLAVIGRSHPPGATVDNLPISPWSIIEHAYGKYYLPVAPLENLPVEQPAIGSGA